MSPFFSASSRRKFLKDIASAGSAVTLYPALAAAREISPTASAPPEVKSFELEEITISELQEGMKSGKFTARSLVEKYTARIEDIDKRPR